MFVFHLIFILILFLIIKMTFNRFTLASFILKFEQIQNYLFLFFKYKIIIYYLLYTDIHNKNNTL